MPLPLTCRLMLHFCKLGIAMRRDQGMCLPLSKIEPREVNATLVFPLGRVLGSKAEANHHRT